MFCDESFPHGDNVWVIDGEHMNRNSADCGSADQVRSCPLEVVGPSVDPGMEEPDDLAAVGIDSREVRAFVPITVKASERQILKSSQAAMLACLDVIGVERQGIDRRRQVAILTSLLRALPDVPDNILSHR